uniref:Uncharacterized protein n=1 Tax=Bosea sp. NBC_00436 TaxID=2969620 RepID=A0A9E8CS80_9HYPH
MLMPASETAGASDLISSATLAGLLRCLAQKGMLKAADIHEIYERALILLEQQQATVPTTKAAFVAARAALESSLRPPDE